MVKQIHIFFSYLREIIFSLDLHRFCLYPVTVLPVGTIGRYFTKVDLRIKVGCKWISVVSAIAVQDINGVDLIKIMFHCICGKYAGYTRIKSASQESCNPRFFESFTIRPLPGIIKICSKSSLFASFFIDGSPLRIIGIFRFVIRGIDIIHLTLQAGLHDRQILIRQRHIQNRIRLIRPDQGNQFFYFIRIYLCRCDLRICGCFQFFL